MKTSLHQHLDQLQESTTFIQKYRSTLNITNDEFIDLCNWFVQNGQLRVYKSSKLYYFWLVSEKEKIQIGYFIQNRNEFILPRISNIEKIKIAYQLFNKKFVYCTSNLLHTAEEVIQQFSGNQLYAFSNSSETYSSIERNSKKLHIYLQTL